MSSTPASPAPFERSRVIHLDRGQRRDPREDLRTVAVAFDALAERPGVPFEALFLANYAAIRQLGRSLREPGVAIVAVHVPSHTLAGRAWVRARPGVINAAVLGRHSRSDLLLSSDPALSLRHLAVVTHPLESWEGSDARYALLDLRTPLALRDERGRHLEALCAEGPAFVSCGDFALFLFQTGDDSHLPELATDAWSALPERVYLDERGAEPDRWQRRAARRRAVAAPIEAEAEAESRSLVTLIPGPVRSDESLLAEHETALGSLTIWSDAGARRIPVGRAAMQRGILLGRYTRCETADLLEHPAISRTHLLVLAVGDRVWALDTASTEGTFIQRNDAPRSARVIPLDGGERVVLGEGRAVVTWRPSE